MALRRSLELRSVSARHEPSSAPGMVRLTYMSEHWAVSVFVAVDERETG